MNRNRLQKQGAEYITSLFSGILQVTIMNSTGLGDAGA